MSIQQGKRVLNIEARAIAALVDRLDDRFAKAVDLLLQCAGKVVVSGMGKSGLIGQKIAATLASTGTPAFFVHPADGIHGDLGMLAKEDALLAISNSGETEEVLKLLPFMKRLGIPIIALTGRTQSTLAKHSDVVLDVSVSEEACPLGLAPTSSTTAALAMGDAVAIALLQKRGFKEEDFAQFHPGGALGRRLLFKVRDLMHQGEALPRVSATASAKDAVREMTSKKLGMTTLVDAKGRLAGVITDGDLRRALAQITDIGAARVDDVMSAQPRSIRPEALAAEAVQIMETHKINQLLVVDARGELVGALNMHDLFRAKVI